MAVIVPHLLKQSLINSLKTILLNCVIQNILNSRILTCLIGQVLDAFQPCFYSSVNGSPLY